MWWPGFCYLFGLENSCIRESLPLHTTNFWRNDKCSENNSCVASYFDYTLYALSTVIFLVWYSFIKLSCVYHHYLNICIGGKKHSSSFYIVLSHFQYSKLARTRCACIIQHRLFPAFLFYNCEAYYITKAYCKIRSTTRHILLPKKTEPL